MVHAFCSHDEDVLRRIDQSYGRPDGGDPEPLLRLRACADVVHIENRILRLRLVDLKCSEMPVGCSKWSGEMEDEAQY